jgi:phospho-N-acetylmuramoyl-pentapeptide-transferase
VQSYGPASHLVKAGTPTMGGILFCTLPIAAWLLLDHGRAGFLVVFAIVAGATIGVVDDLANIRGRGALGLLGRQKLVLQMLVGLLLGIGLDAASLTREVIPGAGAVDLHWGIIPLAALAVVACSNAVNLTDGVDGLAGSCSVIALVAIWAMAQHAGNRPVAIVAASLTGGVLAFLFYNWWPARVFMGDTGSLALGCALVALAAELRLLWLLPLLGAVFVAETLSVIINVTAIRRFGRRVFRASPLHHHFEELGLREQRLVVCFAGAAAVAALLCAAVAVPSGVGAGAIGGVPHP